MDREVYCKGCGVAFKTRPEAPYHLNWDCAGRWEDKCLRDVEEAARAFLHRGTGIAYLQAALDDLTECRKVIGMHGHG